MTIQIHGNNERSFFVSFLEFFIFSCLYFTNTMDLRSIVRRLNSDNTDEINSGILLLFHSTEFSHRCLFLRSSWFPAHNDGWEWQWHWGEDECPLSDAAGPIPSEFSWRCWIVQYLEGSPGCMHFQPVEHTLEHPNSCIQLLIAGVRVDHSKRFQYFFPKEDLHQYPQQAQCWARHHSEWRGWETGQLRVLSFDCHLSSGWRCCPIDHNQDPCVLPKVHSCNCGQQEDSLSCLPVHLRYAEK